MSPKDLSSPLEQKYERNPDDVLKFVKDRIKKWVGHNESDVQKWLDLRVCMNDVQEWYEENKMILFWRSLALFWGEDFVKNENGLYKTAC